MEMQATCIHSLLTLKKRMKNLYMFKAERIPILVATDLASRGLDIPTVDLVINFDVPVEPIDFVHRTGRTARAGRGGTAVTFVTQFDIKLIYSIEEYAGITLEEVDQKLQSTEDQVLDDMPLMSKVMQSIKIRISEGGFEDKLEKYRKQKHNFKNRKSESDNKKQNKQGFQMRKQKTDTKKQTFKRKKVAEESKE
uniref:Helicase C-terminal domain-containing protein n=1 Tax=Euplotes harpa TaxID=151035 RepID=A0A7S3NFU0_9SPIT|mmetsp:Transcript_41447/g.47799  ORF Transcript_41447/g.47799 Transcript_41447/m.47799 type:complete len:195 (+) Transcript_41447:841-1425(+)